MAYLRKRYYIWLVRAYVDRWKKTIVTSVILGVVVTIGIIGFLNFYLRPLLSGTTQNIGYAGAYSFESIPREIISSVSYGLTKIEDNGQVSPSAAKSWKVDDDGKRYTFYLKEKQFFHNGDELTADNIGFQFEGVVTKVVDRYTISYILENPYSPFFVSVSKPIFQSDLSGLGDSKIDKIEINAGFVRSLLIKDPNGRKRDITFYPTQKALKIAFMLGEIDVAHGISETIINDTDLSLWNNVVVKDEINYDLLVTIFYNNNDSILSNKKVRQALNYALPSTLQYGERAFSPIPPTSIYFEKSPNYGISDVEIAQALLSTVDDPITDPLEIKTIREYEDVAKDVQKAWDKIGIPSKITILDKIPSDFQVFIYRFKLPQDPDQYILWHSNQKNNITYYKDLRVDKLLEDGRVEINTDERRKIYADFQKYLTDDVPASFFFFPTSYTLERS